MFDKSIPAGAMAIALALSGLAWGQPTPAGSEFQVNTDTTNDQYQSAVGIAADGSFVVVWQSDASGNRDIEAQRYAADGSTIGSQFTVNTTTAGAQQFPDIAMEADGDFVVVWEGVDANDQGVLGQRYAADGSTIGGEFQINTYTTGFQGRPVVDLAADGRFVVAWTSYQDGSFTSISARRFAADGSAAGNDFVVNSVTTYFQNFPRIAVFPDASFVIAWQSDESGGDDDNANSIQARLFSSAGSPLTGDIQVNTFTTSNQNAPDVEVLSTGDFVVVWRSISDMGDTDSNSIQAQFFSSAGAFIGTQFQLNSHTTGSQTEPRVAADGSGNFLVTWQSSTSPGSDSDQVSIIARAFESDGSPVGFDFQVNTYTTDDQQNPEVAVNAAGELVVVYESYGSPGTDSSYESTLGQRFGGPVPVEIKSFTVK